jgi:hypothetical protein
MQKKQSQVGLGVVLAVTVVVGAGACGEIERGRDSGAGLVMRDSAGVRIVEIPAGPVDTFQTEGSLLTIGEEGDPRYEFDGVRLVAGLADGRIAVVDHGSLAVRYYGADGEHLADFGRSGQGPGEFGFISTAQLLPGDTMVVNDTRARRVSFIAPDLTFAGSVSYVSEMGESDERADACIFPGWQGILTAGERRHALRSWACIYATGSEGSNWYRHSLNLWNPESDEASPVFSMPYVEAWERPGAEIRQRYTTRHFMVARVPTVWEAGIVVPYPDRHALSVYDAAGAHRMEIRDAAPRRATTAAHRDTWTANTDDFFVAATEGIPFPDSLPAFSRSVVGDDGFWALHYDVPGMTGQHWRVYDTDGTRLRVVAFPPGFDLQFVREGRAYGIHEDALGIQRPQVYRVPG